MADDPFSVPERDMKDFQFRQMKKVRVFKSPTDLPKERSNLLAISNKYGLTFVGQDKTLKVFFTQDIISAVKVEGNANSNEIVEDVTCQVVSLDLPVHHLALSSDELTLSVCGSSEQTILTLDFYDVRTFFNKARQEKKPFLSFKPNAALDTLVQDLKWSPVDSFRLAVCLSDGSMIVLDVLESITTVAQLPVGVGITCVCWSPKGKQVAAGKQNGTVVQYTPTLQEKKVIPCPHFYGSDNPVRVLDVLWLSTFNFAVAYAAADGSSETQPEVVVVSLPKKDEKRAEKYLSFSDLVYGTCSERQHHYFLCHVEDWDLVLTASAASIEVCVIAKQEDKTNWELWVLEDASRGELPVTLKSDDTLPMGLAIDYTSQGEIYLSDDKKLPPSPTLLILSTDGVLCPFSLINLNPGVAQLVTAAGRLPVDGERLPSANSSSTPVPHLPVTTAPPPVFPSFQPPSVTASTAPAPAPVPPPSTAPPPYAASASLFSLPSLTSTVPSSFTFGSLTSSASIFSSGFTVTDSKPPSSAFSLSTPSFKPPTEGVGAPAPVQTLHQGAGVSPLSALKPPAEPATPNVRANLNDRFLVPETPAPPSCVGLPFSLTSTPKPGSGDSSILQTPQFSSGKMAAPTERVQSISSAVVQKPTPPATIPPSAPSSQALSVKTVEKQLQQKKETDPILVGILEEIAHFQKEMDEMKARSNRADFRVGSSEEMKQLRKECDDLHNFTFEIKETTESLHGDIRTMKTTILESFVGLEEAQAQSRLNRDNSYLQLLYKKPLDPRSEQQLKEIRQLYQYVKFVAEDVNDVLDMEWEKYLEKKKNVKHLIVPQRETLFVTLANNMEIINQQKQKLDQLTRTLRNLRLYNKPTTWSTPSQPSSTPSNRGLENDLETLKDALLKVSLEAESKEPAKSPSKLTPVKQAQLRNFLSKRQTPPVRSTAPANLSRSAFLSPKYYEDLDDVSSTSSLSQPPEPEDPLAVAEEEEEELASVPVPPPAATMRHPTVVRTPSIQPGFAIQASPFSRVPAGLGPLSTPALPKINMGSADSTALATKTVKHGAPPTEKTTPLTTIPASQAAGQAALSRHMISQKPGAGLTESTLKSVPQVVNVQELKDKGPAVSVPTVISPSVPAPAAQVVQQVLATVEANKNSSQAGLKVIPPVTESTPAPTNFVFGAAAKAETPAVSTATTPVGELNGKTFGFSSVSSGALSFSLNSVSSPSQRPGGSQGNDANQAAKFSFSSSTSKMLFGPSSDTPFSLPPKPAPSSSAPAASLAEPVKLTSTAPSFQPPKGGSGETLGSFSGLRVGQGDEVKETPKTAPSFSLGQSGNGGLSGGFTFGPSQLKPTGSGNGSEPPGQGGDCAKTSPPLGLSATSGVFKPPELTAPSTARPTFSFTSSSLSSAATSFSSLLQTPVSPEPTDKPPATVAPTSLEPAQSTTPEEPSSDPSSEPPAPFSLPPVSVTEETKALTTTASETPVTTVGKVQPHPAPTLEATPVSQASLTPPTEPQTPVTEAPTLIPVTASIPVTTSVPTPGPAPVEQPVTTSLTPAPLPPPSTIPGSIFAQPSVSTSGTTLPVTSFTPVISTATGGTPPTAVTPLTVVTNATAPSPAPVFGQQAGTTPGPAFGTPSFGNAPANSGFFAQPPASVSASNFTFGQSTFGASSGFGQPPAATAPASSSGAGGLFGPSSTSSASSFSFGTSSTTSGANTGTGIFGQSSAPVFGQNSSAFGQGSLFGSSTSTTTSSGFGFGQPAAFGSTPTSSVFGQQPSGGSVFGQSSSSGSLFGSAASNASTSGGGFFSGLGGKPSEDAANKNPFGTTTTGGFGQPSQTAGNLFGNSGAKTFGFGTSAFGEQKSSGTFSAAAGSVSAQGFGSFSTPAKSGGFGSAPVFGSSPSFGSSPAFGASASFGAGAGFNNQLGSSPSKVFGEGTAAANVGGFGFSSPSSAPSFGGLATQGAAPTFGSMAQQPPGFGAQPSGFSGFGSPAGFGGFGNTNTNQSSAQSFSGWRS